MVTYKHLVPAKWGETGFFAQWPRFMEVFGGSMYNAESFTYKRKIYDFSPGNKDEWEYSNDVTFNNPGVTIPDENWIKKNDLTFPATWTITMSIRGDGLNNLARLFLLDSKGNAISKKLSGEQINHGFIEVVTENDMVYLLVNGVKTPFMDKSGVTLTGFKISCERGIITVNSVNFSWTTTNEDLSVPYTNISIRQFNATTPPQSMIIANRVESQGTLSYTTGINPSFTALVFNSSTQGDFYKMDIDITSKVNVSSRVRLQSQSYFTIGFDSFKVEVDGTGVKIIDDLGRVIRDDILTLPSPSETLHVNFQKKGSEISCRVDVENPGSTFYHTGGVFNYPFRGENDKYGIVNLGTTNLYLDYIICGDTEWERFM